ncbi:hypothetical protein SAMN05216486_1089 [bacterium JGI 053]|nr:hypothetical protein SAMN05216486_1089 [bacterium JGI 053]
MKKLQLDGLKVDSFATTAPAPRERGTVQGRELAGTLNWCPVSYGGTCIISVCVCDSDYC